jgi:predicted transcriptional regulator of viral defense system
MPPYRANRLLAHWASRGWLSRVRRGLYVTVSLDAVRPSEWRRDPWVIATTVFAPCYIGGWSAAEHWGLTEQIFADVVVFSATDIRRRRQTIKGTRFMVSSTIEKRMFGLQSVWRDNVRVLVSSPTRTVVDMLDNPRLGGGIKHVAEMVVELITGEHRDDDALIEFGKKLGNKTLFKRLGFIIDATGIDAPRLLSFCRDNVSAGYSQLDPSVRRKGRLLRKWNLAVNVEIGKIGDTA